MTRDRFDAVVVVDTGGFSTRIEVEVRHVFRVSFDDRRRAASLNALSRDDLEALILRTLSHESEPATLAQRSDPISNASMGRMRILIVEDDALLRSSLKRSLLSEARVVGVDATVDTACTYSEAVDALNRGPVDVFLVDVCLDDVDDRSGLAFLEVVRGRNIDSPAFVLTGLREYEVEAHAAALHARYVPKHGLNVADLIRRIFIRPAPESFRPYDSSVQLKQVTVDDAAAYLARAPGGLRHGFLLARKNAVLQVLGENGGNRTAAAKTLGMTRQQVQEILREDRVEEPERKAR